MNPTSHVALTLRGDRVENGIEVSNGQIPFDPQWGLTRHDAGLLAGTTALDGSVDSVHIAVTEHGVVLVSVAGEMPQRELVLVQQYRPGSGSKRWPGFSVELGSDVRQLAEASTSGGSGSECWILVSAPIGWAANIASQFVNERDVGSQTISFSLSNVSKEESGLPKDLVNAFRFDEDLAREFMAKVEALPSDCLDEHIVQNCGRARVKAHLEEVSGDPDFFLGVDPNRVAAYVAEVHFSGDVPAADSGNSAFGDALRAALR